MSKATLTESDICTWGTPAEYAAYLRYREEGRLCWQGMVRRCHSKGDTSYPSYGGKGIRVCREWRKSFKSFIAHIGPRPSLDYSIDRYPNRNGNYEPGNVRWATQQQQSDNKDHAERDMRGLALRDGLDRCLGSFPWIAHKCGTCSELVKSWARGERSVNWVYGDAVYALAMSITESGEREVRYQSESQIRKAKARASQKLRAGKSIQLYFQRYISEVRAIRQQPCFAVHADAEFISRMVARGHAPFFVASALGLSPQRVYQIIHHKRSVPQCQK